MEKLFLEPVSLEDAPLESLYERVFDVSGDSHKSWAGGTFTHHIIDYLNKSGAELITSNCVYGHIQKHEKEVAKLLSPIFPKGTPSNFTFHYKYKGNLIRVGSDDIVFGSLDRFGVTVCGQDFNDVQNICNELSQFKKKEDPDEDPTPTFGVIYTENGNVQIKDVSLDMSVSLDVGMNYGESFLKKHEALLEKITTRSTGLYLLHGIPGSGKTTYLKYLSQVSSKKENGKKFIFVPNNQIESLTNPSILPILLRNSNSVLILEDAERAIISREEGGDSSIVSTLLNFSDGILGSMLNVSLIVTFNTAKDRIDSALKRKGRLVFEHYFDKLSVADSLRLAKHLNKKGAITEPMSLADIYNLEDENYSVSEAPKRVIGFGQ